MKYLGETCKAERCSGKRLVVGYSVSDEIWDRVTGGTARILCLPCFDELAEVKGVPYKILALHPVTWDQWTAPEEDE